MIHKWSCAHHPSESGLSSCFGDIQPQELKERWFYSTKIAVIKTDNVCLGIKWKLIILFFPDILNPNSYSQLVIYGGNDSYHNHQEWRPKDLLHPTENCNILYRNVQKFLNKQKAIKPWEGFHRKCRMRMQNKSEFMKIYNLLSN